MVVQFDYWLNLQNYLQLGEHFLNVLARKATVQALQCAVMVDLTEYFVDAENIPTCKFHSIHCISILSKKCIFVIVIDK